MRLTPYALASLSLVLVACGPAEPKNILVPIAPPPPASGSAAADIHAPPVIDVDPNGASRILADVKYLASDELAGRGTGTPGGLAARDYVVKRFTELGLEPGGDPSSPVGGGYLQAFKARVGAKAAPPVFEIVTKAVGKGVDQGKPLDAAGVVTADGSASGQASGTAIFVGYGVTAAALSWDDYAKIDCKGKVALVLSGPPPGEKFRDFGSSRYKLRTAREHGCAAAVIIVQDKLPAAPSDVSSMGVPAVAATNKALQPVLRAMQLSDKALKDAKPIDRLKPPTLHVVTKLDPVEADSWNVLGVMRAQPKSDEYVVVGAHYDHLGHGGTSASRSPGVDAIHPGADDNASGTALVLEVAYRLSKLPQKPERNILFMAFGAEEIGVIGSRFFTDHPTVPLDKIDAMINADMVGRLRENKLVVDGLGTAQPWTDLVKTASAGLDFNLAFGSEGFGASDHASFTAARVPTAFFFTGVHDDYHRPTDTFDKINTAGEERVATMVARLAVSVADRSEKLAFIDAPADPHRGAVGGGFRVSLGTMPDYAFQGKGLRLTGVRADAPASRAGLQGGDIITKLGTHEITNIHDYMFALGELEPGREVPIEVDRNGQKLSLKIVPAPGH